MAGICAMIRKLPTCLARALLLARAQTHVHITHISVVVKTLSAGRSYRAGRAALVGWPVATL